MLPFLGKNVDERRVIINSIGATWEGESALVYHRWRCYSFRLPHRICDGLLRLLYRIDADAVFPAIDSGVVWNNFHYGAIKTKKEKLMSDYNDPRVFSPRSEPSWHETDPV